MNPEQQINLLYESSPSLPDVTCVCENPRQPGLLFGLEDGSIIFTDAQNSFVSSPQQLSIHGNAINSVATVSPNSLALSTRSEVMFLANQSVATFPGGAHGVIATYSGSYVAPLGSSGLLIVRPTDSKFQKMEIAKLNENEQLYFYRVAALRNKCGKEALIFANRKDGVGSCVFKSNERRRVIHKMGSEGVDVIDVCAIKTDSLSALAISTSAELLWFKDASSVTAPITYQLTDVKGTIYRLLASERHLFVLTSKSLYVWFDFVTRAIQEQFSMPELLRLVLPIEAIDITLINKDYLLLVMGANKIKCLSIPALEDQLKNKTHPKSNFENDLGIIEHTPLADINQPWHNDVVDQEDHFAYAA